MDNNGLKEEITRVADLTLDKTKRHIEQKKVSKNQFGGIKIAITKYRRKEKR